MFWKRVVSFLPKKNIGDMALACRQFASLVSESVCWDIATINAANGSVFPMRSCRCVIADVDCLPLKLCDAIVPISLRFSVYFNRPLEKLPLSLEGLVFSNCFNQPILPGVLPPLLTHLVFRAGFNQSIGHGVLPPTLKYLAFFFDFDQPIERGVLPSSLTSLHFGFDFNQPLAPGVLPSSLTSLEFGYKFNQPILPGVLPPSLTSLEFGYHFNQQLTADSSPPSLRVVKLSKFSQLSLLFASNISVVYT